MEDMRLKFIIDKEYDLGFLDNEEDIRELERRYEKDASSLPAAVDAYQESWDKINEAFSAYVERVTDHPWAHETYYCVVSLWHPGISNWDGSDRIVRWWGEDPLKMRRITAHELILHHYFVIIKRDFADEGLEEIQIWALAEIAAFAMTSLTPEARTFWPWDETGYYTDHNYPSIVDLQLALREPFINRKNFKEYVQAGIEAVKDYPQTIRHG